MSHFNRRYMCYNGDQYTFLNHILPQNHIELPLDQRPTIRPCTKKDVRDLTFVTSQERVRGSRNTNVRGGAPYQFYSRAIDVESQLRTLNQPLNDCDAQRYQPSTNSSLYHVNTVSNTTKHYQEINSPASCVVPSKNTNTPCSLEQQYQTEFNDGRFHNHTRNSKYQYENI